MKALCTCDRHEECRLLADTLVIHTESTRSRRSFYSFLVFAASIAFYGRIDGPRSFIAERARIPVRWPHIHVGADQLPHGVYRLRDEGQHGPGLIRLGLFDHEHPRQPGPYP